MAIKGRGRLNKDQIELRKLNEIATEQAKTIFQLKNELKKQQEVIEELENPKNRPVNLSNPPSKIEQIMGRIEQNEGQNDIYHEMIGYLKHHPIIVEFLEKFEAHYMF